MKKKQKTYVLLTAVLFIWGAIGFQFFKRLYPATTEITATSVINTFKKREIQQVVFYSLQQEYRDPFLGGYPKPKRVTKKVKKVTSKPEVIFPKITYNGIIQGRKSSASFIITINGKQEILEKGDITNEVTLVKGNGEEITIRYKGETKKIQKQ